MTMTLARPTNEDNGITREDYGREKLNLLKQTVCKGATDAELELFVHVCKRTGLDPFARQIYAIKRNQGGQQVMVIQTGIDGYRLIADRTGRYAPGREPTFTYDADGRVTSATAYVKKQTADGTWHECCATAHYDEYVGLNREGQPTQMWFSKPHILLGKCAEALSLRRAFPAELSGVYTSDEMDQANNPESAPAPRQPVLSTVPQIGHPARSQAEVDAVKKFNDLWLEAMTARGCSQEKAFTILNGMLAQRGKMDVDLTDKDRAALLMAAASGKFDKLFKVEPPKPNLVDEALGNQPDPDADGGDIEPPPPAKEMTDEEKFVAQVQEACIAAEVLDGDRVVKALKSWATRCGVVGKMHTAKPEQKQVLFECIAQHRGDWSFAGTLK